MGNHIRIPHNGIFISELFTKFLISVIKEECPYIDNLFQEFDSWKNESTLSINFSDVIDKVVHATGFSNNIQDYIISTSKGNILENIHSIFIGRTFRSTYANLNTDVSQVHAFVCIIGNKLIIVDLISKNGTKITVSEHSEILKNDNFYYVVNLDNDIKIDTGNDIPLCHVSIHDKKIVIY